MITIILKKYAAFQCNLFDIKSIHNIEKISSEEFKALNPAFKRFSQSMQKTDIKLLKPLLILLEKKRKAF